MFGPGIAGGVPSTAPTLTVRSFPPPRAPFSYATLGNPFYVDSVAGGNVYPYDTWAHAATTLATIGASGKNFPGNTLYVDKNHNESTAAPVSMTWAGTAALPTRILCADKTTGEPPTVLATGGTVSTSGNSSLTIASGAAALYIYGLTFISGSGGSTAAPLTVGIGVLGENCSFQLASTGASGLTASAGCSWNGCTVKFSAAGSAITGTVSWRWSGGSLLSGGTSPTALFTTPLGLVENVDLSNADPAMNIASASLANLVFSIRNCQLPALWSGAFNSSTPQQGSVLALHNCDSAGTNYILHRQTQFGDAYSETTLVRTGGASDGTTPLSWKMVSVAASGTFPITALQTGEFVIWNDTTGSPKTITVEVLYDSATTLQNDEIWLEVNYYAASGNPQGTLVSSAMANVLSTPANIASSTATWTTTGMSNPNPCKLSVGPITPQLKGYFLATVKLCKPSYTVYVDPLMTVS
jgi:hypothetical protein